jgi:hypothetical protein
MDVLHRAEDRAQERGGVGFEIVALGAYPVEELATRAEVEDEVEVVRGLVGE